MVSLLSVGLAQEKVAGAVRARRLRSGLTQEGLAKRADVSLASLRKFEQKGLISLESFLKLLMVLDALDDVVQVLDKQEETNFQSIDDVLQDKPRAQPRKKGWRS